MRNPKVLIGCPISDRYEYCVQDYIEAIKNIDYDNYDILLVDNSQENTFCKKLQQQGIDVKKVPYDESVRKRIVDSRNMIREHAIKNNYDYMFSLEADVMVQPDTLKRLLEAKKDIITAYYAMSIKATLKHNETGELKEVQVDLPVAYVRTSEQKLRRAHQDEVTNQGIKEVAAAGIGCMLISADVLKKISFRYQEGKKAFDDIYFCHDAQNVGYRIYIDTDIQLEHKHRRWADIRK